MAEKNKKPVEAQEERRGLFGVYDDVRDLVTSEIGRFKPEAGSNRIRIITPPIPVPKHWDVPKSADAKVINCLAFWGHRASEMGDPAKRKEILDSLPACPWCELEAQYGDKALGKDQGYYNRQYTHVLGVVHKGKALLWEVSQKSIMDQLGRFEKEPEWAQMMPNGLQDMEILVSKVESKGKRTEYTVGGAPMTKALTDEELEEFRSQLPDILSLVKPLDVSTEEGQNQLAELLRKNGAPVKGDEPKKL